MYIYLVFEWAENFVGKGEKLVSSISSFPVLFSTISFKYSYTCSESVLLCRSSLHWSQNQLQDHKQHVPCYWVEINTSKVPVE